MKLLITGGFGYLGGRLAHSLASGSGHEILLGSRQNLEPPEWLPIAGVVQTCWDSPNELDGICAGADAIVHLAGMNAKDCAVDPVAALEMNGLATARLLRAAIRQGVKRIILMSTAHVYCQPLSGVITEQTCPRNLHPYATSCRAGEDVVMAAAASGDIEGIVIRLSNAFGAPIHEDANCWSLLVNDLCRQAVTTRRMSMRSSGLQRRDFVTMHDVVRAVSHLLDLPEASGDIFNVGGGWAPMVIEMAELIQSRCADIFHFTPEIVRPAANSREASLALNYSIDKLAAIGFVLNGDHVAEIDDILHFCRKRFVA